MNSRTALKERTASYTLRKSEKARYVRLSVYSGGQLVVTAPSGASLKLIEQFITKKAQWIARTVRRLSKYQAPVLPRRSSREYAKHKAAALSLATKRVAHFNAHYMFAAGRVSVRNQKTRWGSCSKKGHLSFNYKIALLPPELADYLVVHELCHLKEFNHKEEFWSLVGETLPNYAYLRQTLKRW
jgi:predicted metal-dependent hydrolase